MDAIFGLIEREIVPFDPLTPKNPTQNEIIIIHHIYFPIQTQNKNHKNSHTIGGLPEKPKHEVDRITRCGDMAI